MKMNRVKKMIAKIALAVSVFTATLSFAQSDAKAGGAMQWGNITTGSEDESFYFTLDQASKITFINNKAYDSSAYVSIKDVGKETIAGTGYDWGKGARYIAYLEPGEYEIEVKFGMDVNVTCDVVTETVKESYTDRNDEKNTAVKLEVGKKYDGVRGANDPVDFYSFTLKESSNVNVIFNSPTEYDGVTLLNAKGEFVYSCKTGIGTHSDAYVLPAGTYYLEMRDTTSSGNYFPGYVYTLQVNAKALQQAQMKTVKSKQSKIAVLTAVKQSGAVKYEFQIAKDKNFKKIVKSVVSKKNTVSVKKLKSGQKLYVRVRCQYSQAIRDDVRPEIPVCSKPVISYNKWSNAKSVKIK